MAIVVSCFVVSDRIQGQGTGTNLDQMKLMQQFLGVWQVTLPQDSLLLVEIKQVDDAFLETDYLVVKDEKSIISIWNYSYDPEKDKFMIFALNTKGKYDTYIASFTSEKEWEQLLVTDFAPDKILRRDVFVFTSSSEMKSTAYSGEGKKVGEAKFVRLK